MVTKSDLIGVVVDNNDPKHLHRLRIRVSEWHTDVPDAQLPWFVPQKLDAWGATATGGSFGPALIGSKMWVALHNGDPHSPIYKGYFQDLDCVVPECIPNYPHRAGFSTGGQDYFYIDRQNGDTVFHHRTGTQISIDGATGRCTLNVVEKTIVNSVGEIDVNCPTLNLNANLNIVGSYVHHNGVNIGDTHEHGGIVKGGADTSGPH